MAKHRGSTRTCHAVRPRGVPRLPAGPALNCLRLDSNSPRPRTTRGEKGVKIGRSIHAQLKRQDYPGTKHRDVPHADFRCKNKTKLNTTHFPAGKIRANVHVKRKQTPTVVRSICTTAFFYLFLEETDRLRGNV